MIFYGCEDRNCDVMGFRVYGWMDCTDARIWMNRNERIEGILYEMQMLVGPRVVGVTAKSESKGTNERNECDGRIDRWGWGWDHRVVHRHHLARPHTAIDEDYLFLIYTYDRSPPIFLSLQAGSGKAEPGIKQAGGMDGWMCFFFLVVYAL